MAVEYRLVNDNGVQKVIKLDITKPNKKGMPADTTATIVNGDLRTILPLKGSTPISAEEVSIEEWAPTYPGSPTNTWKSSTKSFTDEEIPNLIHRVRNLLKSPNRLLTGGWLAKFDLGGTMQQPDPDAQKRMKELLLIINGAAKELSTKQPGDNVAYLAQVMQDPQEVALIDAIIAEIPDAQEVIDQVSQLSSQMFKCGGKAKKKVKKGAKGCIPCKKLMKIGGRLVNVLTDCEGNIISKHLSGGWIVKAGGGIPGGFAYGDRNLLTFDDIKTTTGTTTDEAKYYWDNGNVMKTTWDGQQWKPGERYTSDTLDTDILNGTINLWKDKYNPRTGLFEGQTVTSYKDDFGIRGGGYNTLDVLNQNLTQIKNGNVTFTDVDNNATTDDSQNIAYMPATWRVARRLRKLRRKNYWDNLVNGVDEAEALLIKQSLREQHRNFLYGSKMSQEAIATANKYGITDFVDPVDGKGYKKARREWKNKMNSTVTSPANIEVGPAPAAGTSGSPTAGKPATMTNFLVKSNKQGGWLTKFN